MNKFVAYEFFHTGAKVNARTEKTGVTALSLACKNGFLEIVSYLTKADTDIQLSNPLIDAAYNGHFDITKYLLNSAADVQAETGTGETALTYACANGHTAIVQLLLQFGAKLVQ